MALHPLQGPLDRMIDYLSDAQRIHDVIQERLRQTTADRRAQGSLVAGSLANSTPRSTVLSWWPLSGRSKRSMKISR